MKGLETGLAPQLEPRRTVRQLMGLVLLALLPGIAASTAFFGQGVWMQVLLAVSFALLLEAAMLRLRGRPLRPFLTDLSAPLAAVLFALCLPPLAPWWIAAIGMFAAIVIAKHLFGGLGGNVFNPAMVGVAVVLVSFPAEFTHWLPPAGINGDLPVPGLLDSARAILVGQLPPPWHWDALAQATPLDAARNLSAQGYMLAEIRQQPVFGALSGKGWEWIALAWLSGGLFLLWKKIIPWQVPVGLVAAVFIAGTPAWLSDPMQQASPLSQLFSGGLLLAAFFIATDPVTGCTTPRGRLLFGAGVGLLALSIRHWGAYPDGVAFAVLLMNCAAPLLDSITRPRYRGEDRGGSDGHA